MKDKWSELKDDINEGTKELLDAALKRYVSPPAVPVGTQKCGGRGVGGV